MNTHQIESIVKNAVNQIGQAIEASKVNTPVEWQHPNTYFETRRKFGGFSAKPGDIVLIADADTLDGRGYFNVGENPGLVGSMLPLVGTVARVTEQLSSTRFKVEGSDRVWTRRYLACVIRQS